MIGWRFGLSAAALSAGLLAMAFGSSPLPLAGAASRTQAITDPAPQLHVSGNRLVNSHGGRVVLHGVDRSGGEYTCVHGFGIWDGPMNQASLTAMKRWNVNAVRVPLNEACWNGQSYVSGKYRGAAYRRAVEAYVRLLGRNGMVAILELHWTDGLYTGPSSGCSSARALCQKPMPDAAESLPFWTSVARTFKGNDSVIFDLFNEPYPERAAGASESGGWRCWLHGGRCAGIGYRVAGMQTLVRQIRSTGSRNVIMLGGLEYANDLSQWLSHEPIDPDHNLVASWHSYKKNACSTRSCWVTQIAPVIARVPVIAGEIGEGDCADTYIVPLMRWLDSKSTGYLAWAWNADFDCSAGPSLITSYSGTPTPYGEGYRAHLRSLK
jgi:endoglucanase